MSDNGTKQLEAWRNDKFDKLKRNVAEGSFAEAEANLKSISLLDETISKAKSQKEPVTSKRKFAIIFGLGAILLLTAASSVRILETDFKATVVVQSLTMVTSNPWASDDIFEGVDLSINNLASLSSPGLGFPDILNGHYSLTSRHDSIPSVVGELAFADSAGVSLKSDSGQLTMFVRRDSLSLSIIIPAGAAVEIRGDSSIQFVNKSDAQLMSVTSFPVKEDPVILAFNGIDDWKFEKLGIQAITFDNVVEANDNLAFKESSVLSGSLTIAQTGRKLDFESGDVIEFTSLKTRRLVITPQGSTMVVSIEGSASKILHGISGFEENLNPTLAGCLYSNSIVAFIWTSLGFLYLLLWNIKKTFFQNEAETD